MEANKILDGYMKELACGWRKNLLLPKDEMDISKPFQVVG